MWNFCGSLKIWYPSRLLIELSGTQKHTLCQGTSLYFSEILYLSHFSVESHKMRGIVKLWVSSSSFFVFIICLRLPAISGQAQSLLVCRYGHSYLNSSCLMSHLCSAFFCIWLGILRCFNTSHETKYPEDSHGNVNIRSQWGENGEQPITIFMLRNFDNYTSRFCVSASFILLLGNSCYSRLLLLFLPS